MQNKRKKYIQIVGKCVCIINILCGISGIIIACIVKNVEPSLSVDQELRAYKENIPVALFVFASISIITSLLGFVAYSKTIRPFGKAFLILNITLCIAFFIVFVMFLNKQLYIQQELTFNNCKTGPLSELNEVYNSARQIWCKSDPLTNMACPCNLSRLGNWSREQQRIIKKEFDQISGNGSKQIQSCNNAFAFIPNLDSHLTFLRVIEDQYKCSGICNPENLVYYFTDINQGPPEHDSCFEIIKSRIIVWTKSIYILAAISFLFALINIIICKFIHFSLKITLFTLINL